MRTTLQLATLSFLALAACADAGPVDDVEPTPSEAALRPRPIDPCATVRCRAGFSCEVTNGKVTCVPEDTGKVQCKRDEDCRLVANYCGGCNCLALGPGQSEPKTCDEGEVACLVFPCFGLEAVCEAGRCTTADEHTF